MSHEPRAQPLCIRETCRQPFTRTGPRQLYCSTECRRAQELERLAQRPPAPEPPNVLGEAVCAYEPCGRTFQRRRYDHRFCGSVCKKLAWRVERSVGTAKPPAGRAFLITAPERVEVVLRLRTGTRLTVEWLPPAVPMAPSSVEPAPEAMP